ncbi:hypothetical protein HPFOLIGI_00969 [Mannheimia haemolytica]|nr:hypothetical protein [Mannheimia haemolytica]
MEYRYYITTALVIAVLQLFYSTLQRLSAGYLIYQVKTVKQLVFSLS